MSSETPIGDKPRGFHLKDGLFFNRLDGGRVEILYAEGVDPKVKYRVETDTMGWASVVCTVSAQGENLKRWMAAQRFHENSASDDVAQESQQERDLRECVELLKEFVAAGISYDGARGYDEIQVPKGLQGEAELLLSRLQAPKDET